MSRDPRASTGAAGSRSGLLRRGDGIGRRRIAVSPATGAEQGGSYAARTRTEAVPDDALAVDLHGGPTRESGAMPGRGRHGWEPSAAAAAPGDAPRRPTLAASTRTVRSPLLRIPVALELTPSRVRRRDEHADGVGPVGPPRGRMSAIFLVVRRHVDHMLVRRAICRRCDSTPSLVPAAPAAPVVGRVSSASTAASPCACWRARPPPEETTPVATEPASTLTGDRAVRAPRAEGQWALGHTGAAQRLTRRSATTTAPTCATVSRPPTRRASARSIRATRAAHTRWWGYTSASPASTAAAPACSSRTGARRRVFTWAATADFPRGLRAIADVSQAYGRDTADITDRQNVHWIRVEVPSMAAGVRGSTTNEARGGHAARRARFVLSPASPTTRSSTARPRSRRSCAATRRRPRSPTRPQVQVRGPGHVAPRRVAHEVNDVFIGVVHPEHGPGFDVSTSAAACRPT